MVYRAAQGFESLLEESNQALVIVVAGFTQAVGCLGTQFLECIVRQNSALEGIQEAYAEVVAVARSYLRIGAGQADGGNIRILEILRTRDGHAGTIGTQHHGHIFRNQLLCRGRSLVSRRTVVRHHQLYFVGGSADLYRRGNNVRILDAQSLLLAAGTGVTGSGLKHTDFHHRQILRQGDGKAAQRQNQRQHNHQGLFHSFFLLKHLLFILKRTAPSINSSLFSDN